MTRTKPLLVSVHLPKTAGTSFVEGAQRAFQSPKSVRWDYADLPLHAPIARRHLRAVIARELNALRPFLGVSMIHGHFLPIKYSKVRRECVFITWMRDPVERLVSHYDYWRRIKDPSEAIRPVHRRMINENWSLDRFAFAEEVRNIYAQFLWRFPIERFAFIGITEHYQEDLTIFARQYLHTEMEPLRTNVRPDDPRETPARWRERVEEFHSVDMALYRTALKMRDDRLRRTEGHGLNSLSPAQSLV